MSSTYNTRPRPAEVLVDGDRVTSINERQTFAQLMETERVTRDLPVVVAVSTE